MVCFEEIEDVANPETTTNIVYNEKPILTIERKVYIFLFFILIFSLYSFSVKSGEFLIFFVLKKIYTTNAAITIKKIMTFFCE